MYTIGVTESDEAMRPSQPFHSMVWWEKNSYPCFSPTGCVIYNSYLYSLSLYCLICKKDLILYREVVKTGIKQMLIITVFCLHKVNLLLSWVISISLCLFVILSFKFLNPFQNGLSMSISYQEKGQSSDLKQALDQTDVVQNPVLLLIGCTLKDYQENNWKESTAVFVREPWSVSSLGPSIPQANAT